MIPRSIFGPHSQKASCSHASFSCSSVLTVVPDSSPIVSLASVLDPVNCMKISVIPYTTFLVSGLRQTNLRRFLESKLKVCIGAFVAAV